MYQRVLEQELTDLARHYSIVSLMGPRQSGKTTLVKHVFADKSYLNLEAPDIRQLAIADPRDLLERYPIGAIFDETQRVPKLLSYLQVIVDEHKQKKRYIITSSHQLPLFTTINQSLAGRAGLLHSYPLTLMS